MDIDSQTDKRTHQFS